MNIVHKTANILSSAEFALPFAMLVALVTPFVGSDSIAASLDVPPRPEPSLRRHPDDRSSARFDRRRSATCLKRSKALLKRHRGTLSAMSSGLDEPMTAFASCSPLRWDRPFDAFEGKWSGRWQTMPVRHLWRTVSPGVQLVVIRDGEMVRHGINLQLPDGQICGLVVAPDGTERPHHGRFFPATSESPAYLRWLTPHSIYRERVTCGPSERAYIIVEERITGNRVSPGTIAVYVDAEPTTKR